MSRHMSAVAESVKCTSLNTNGNTSPRGISFGSHLLASPAASRPRANTSITMYRIPTVMPVYSGILVPVKPPTKLSIRQPISVSRSGIIRPSPVAPASPSWLVALTGIQGRLPVRTLMPLGLRVGEGLVLQNSRTKPPGRWIAAVGR